MASSSSCQQLVGASHAARLHWSLVLAALSPAAISGGPRPLIHIQSQSQAPGSSQHQHHLHPLHNPLSVYHQTSIPAHLLSMLDPQYCG
ncbi:hypothetical protein CgunFtcFv8_004267 [Champsocephalus gunnari]|uniref:Uncharacterized protein n=1 Tax=Champsocephalus gunnari TaxID=52237 RepID=A0AAN8E2L5_CHAGU|nr:hypothetical protein CgunFtcFv8_004267 [Champsocephalus gunnari]